MTNEQLATFIQQGGNDELIPILWERVKNLLYMKSDKAYKAYKDRFCQCGVEMWDLKQQCYIAFLEAVRGFKPDAEYRFNAYLSYPFKNAVNELLGIRTSKREPLNNCNSLDVPLDSEDTDGTRTLDMLIDENAVDVQKLLDTDAENKVLHNVVDNLKYPYNYVIKEYYFNNRPSTEICKDLNMSSQTVMSRIHKALMILRNNKTIQELWEDERRTRFMRAVKGSRGRSPEAYMIHKEIMEKYYNKARCGCN